MPYRIAGIDVHKKKLAVVVADIEVEDEYQFERRWYGSNPEQLRVLSEWLVEQQIEEVVMESTAQYWKPECVPGTLSSLAKGNPCDSFYVGKVGEIEELSHLEVRVPTP